MWDTPGFLNLISKIPPFSYCEKQKAGLPFSFSKSILLHGH